MNSEMTGEGVWRPAVPLPFYSGLLKKRCPFCWKPFWTAKRYRKHCRRQHVGGAE
ncbi:hypothetical protein [Streptomyces sp. RLB1-9]|uniref:hypothetical protein n=1 Tax=Streptomyces sp. RLB1-9 TaxID=2594454 RepID=UPI0013DD8427|nr:hypothetical protein [Streptomyces sp. RLB1-9]